MGSFKMVGGLMLIVVVVYLLVVLAPPYFNEYQFEDVLRTEAQMNTYSTKSEEEIRESVFKKAQQLDIPIAKESIKVVRTGPQNAGSVSIDAPYVVHVNLPAYPLDLTFNPSTRNKSVF